MLGGAIHPLDGPVETGGDDRIGCGIHDRVVAGILPLAQHPFAGHRDGDVVDLQQAMVRFAARRPAGRRCCAAAPARPRHATAAACSANVSGCWSCRLERVLDDRRQPRIPRRREICRTGPCRAPPAWAVAMTRAIQSFQPTIRRLPIEHDDADIHRIESRAIFEFQTRYSTLPVFCRPIPSMKSSDDVPQRGDRGQIHEQSDEAMNVAILDREVDVKEQNQIVASRRSHRTASRHRRG